MTMSWCPKYKINVDELADCNCLGCIFSLIMRSGGDRTVACQYDIWYPGLIKDKSYKEIEDINKEIEDKHND